MSGWVRFFFRKKYAECCRFLQGWWNMKRLEDDQGNEQIVPFFYIFFAYLYQNFPIWFAKKKWAKSESSQEGRRNGCLQGRPQRAWRCKVDQVFEWRVLFGVCCWRFGFASFPQVFHGTIQSMDAAPKLQVQEVSTSASKLWWNSFAATFWQSFSQFFAKNQDAMYKNRQNIHHWSANFSDQHFCEGHAQCIDWVPRDEETIWKGWIGEMNRRNI